MSKVLIIGGGPAGMIASVMAARNNHQVVVFERNEKLGKKLFITGKGRCNITNACDVEELLKHVVTNPKFLYSAFYSFTSWDMIDFLNQLGLATKIERGNRVFPESDKSSDVISALQSEMKRQGIDIRLNAKVKSLDVQDGQFKGLVLENGRYEAGDSVIVCTGGLSYASTGSTGDGYLFARELGLEVKETAPSLVPMNVSEEWCKSLQGLSLKNAGIQLMNDKKTLYTDFGEMLFTHFGVSGPAILRASAHCARAAYPLKLVIDLKPALDNQQLDARIIRDFEQNSNKQFRNGLSGLLPVKLIPVIIEQSGIDPYKPIHDITRAERERLVHTIKNLSMHVAGLRSYNEAVITKGGIAVGEIDPSTMESKKNKGVYFAGEVLDLDALTGGFNLQIAWSTGYLAGINV